VATSILMTADYEDDSVGNVSSTIYSSCDCIDLKKDPFFMGFYSF